MRTFKIIGLAGFALLSVSSILVVKSAMAIEKAKYTVLEKEDGFEIREYNPQIVAETFVEGDLKKAGNDGFRRLYAYISGEHHKAVNLHDGACQPGNRFEKNCHDSTSQTGEER